MPRVDPIIDDLRTFGHEAGHAVAVVVNGGSLIRVIGHRHHARAEDEAGSCEYLRRGMTAWQEGFAALAGIACSEGSAVLLDQGTRDEREAAELVGAELMPELRRSAFAWSLRRDVQAAVYAVSGLLMDAPDATLPGIPIERVVFSAINPRTRPTAPARLTTGVRPSPGSSTPHTPDSWASSSRCEPGSGCI